VQEELGGLAHGADEQQARSQVDGRPVVADEAPLGAGDLVNVREDLGELDDPNIQKTVMMPRAKPKSPTRLTTKALMAAALALSLWCQKPISR